MDLRSQIIDWVKVNGGKSHWLLDVYYHLIDNGATTDDASKALDQFVTEICALKAEAEQKVPAE